MKPHPEFEGFLNAYPSEVQELTMNLRSFITDLVPEANELIWDNYNALAMAYSKSEVLSDAFCHLAVYGKHVNVGFNRATEIETGRLTLAGKGKLIRHLTVNKWENFPQEEVREVILNALVHADFRNPVLASKTKPGESIVKSVSEKKRRPKSG